jgi:benzodiazapine receptor
MTARETQRTYLALKQPPLRPPPWVFGPVWTILYGLMGYAAHRAVFNGLSPFSSPDTIRATKHSMTLYTIQLGLNLAWMPLFFGINRPVEATVDILGLIGVNGYLTYLWSSIDDVSTALQFPYLGWLSFATYLCIGTGYLNNWDLDAASKASAEEGKKQD